MFQPHQLHLLKLQQYLDIDYPEFVTSSRVREFKNSPCPRSLAIDKRNRHQLASSQDYVRRLRTIWKLAIASRPPFPTLQGRERNQSCMQPCIQSRKINTHPTFRMLQHISSTSNNNWSTSSGCVWRAIEHRASQRHRFNP